MKAAESSGNRVVRKIRVRAILFLVLALVAGGGAVLLVKKYMDQLDQSRQAPTTVTKVAVAAVDLPIGSQLELQQLQVVDWPVASKPDNSFSKVEDVVGKTLLQAVVKGEPILASRLADETAGRGLTAILAKGKRAMAVKVDQVVGIAGFVQPGDYVDVITTIAPDEETRTALKEKAARISKIILQNIKVLAVGEHMATQGNKPVKVQVVTLEVTPDESERIALATRYGDIQLTMRSRIDQENVPTEGITPVALLSPEGEAPKKDEDQASKMDAATRQLIAMRRKQRKLAQEKAKEPEKPAAPVVEVLRGDKIEERKLRPSADSK